MIGVILALFDKKHVKSVLLCTVIGLKQINMYRLTTQEGKYRESSQLNQTKSQIECQIYDNHVILVRKIDAGAYRQIPKQIFHILNLLSKYS